MNLPTNQFGKLTGQKTTGPFETYGIIRKVNDTYIEFEDSDGDDKFKFKIKWIKDFEIITIKDK